MGAGEDLDPDAIAFAKPNMRVKKTMNGIATRTHATVVYPFVHNRFKIHVQNKNHKIFRTKTYVVF